MRILALDTSLEACSVALYDAAKAALLSEAHEVPGRGHAEILFHQIDRVFAAAGATHADIDRYAVTVGPGSFTGVRVGLAAARGLALASGKPLVGIGTLEAIAAAVERADAALVIAHDARRNELYVQVFCAGDRQPPYLADVGRAAQHIVALGAKPLAIAGTGSQILVQALAQRGAEARILTAEPWPRASAVARLAAGRDDPGSGRPGPVYLRAPDARLPGA